MLFDAYIMLSLQERKTSGLCKVFIILLVFTFVSVVHLNLRVNRMTEVVTPAAERVGRYAANGHWYSQSVPFHLHVFSAFYDNRTSLMSNVSQVVVISQFRGNPIDRCVLWFSYGGDHVLVPATAQSLNLADKVIVCTLLINVTRGRLPFDVTLAWTNKTAATGVSKGAVSRSGRSTSLADEPWSTRAVSVGSVRYKSLATAVDSRVARDAATCRSRASRCLQPVDVQ